MSHRLPGALALLCSSLVSFAACGGGGGGGDDEPVDATSVDAPAIDASPDASPDAMTDAMQPLAGETCQIAELITISGGVGNATVSGTTVGYTNNYVPPSACTDGYDEVGPDHAYEIAVPAGQRVTATVTAGAGFDSAVYFLRTPAAHCDANPIVCLAGDDTGGAAGVDSAFYDNVTDSAVNVFLVVDGTRQATGGTYTMAVTVGAPPLPSAGETCQVAEPITLTSGLATVTGTTTTAAGYENDYEPPEECTDFNVHDGNDRVYAATVPANSSITAVITPEATFDVSGYIIAAPAASCDATPIVCLDGEDEGAEGDPDTLFWNNLSGSPVDVFVVVDSYSPTHEGTYSMSVAMAANVAGDSCQLAESVTLVNNMATVLATAAGYANNYDADPDESAQGCTGYAEPGGDRVHIVRVLAGQVLDATVTPTASTFEVAIYMVAAPAASCDAAILSCVAGADVNYPGEAESTSYHNTTGADVDVFVIVDSFATGGDAYMLQLEVGPPT